MIENDGTGGNLPPISKPEPISDFLQSDEWFGTPINRDEWLDFREPYVQQRFLLSFRGRPFARIGDVQVISGQAGHGKSMLLSQIVTAILRGEFGGLKYELSDTIPNPIVLYIDTEQSKDDVIASKNRVMRLCGWGVQEERCDYWILMLRTTETAIERWKKVLQAIYMVKPNVVILDGIIDVVRDFNDQKECADIIYKCMQLATHYEAAMMCVLHQNPLSAKLVGHLGSAAMRKVTDIIQVSKDKKTNDVIFNVTQIKARGHQDIEDWQFRVLPTEWGIPEQVVNTAANDVRIEDIEKWLREGRYDVEWPAYESAIKDIFKERGNIKGSDALQDCVKRAKNRRFITDQPREEWQTGQKHPKYYLSF